MIILQPINYSCVEPCSCSTCLALDFFVLFTSSITNTSIMSPSFMSLYPSICNPHSNPFVTSLTSSLNLFNDASFPVWITTSSLITLTPAFLSTFPSFTYPPAIVPTFDTLNVCLTSTFPITFSSYTGSNSLR